MAGIQINPAECTPVAFRAKKFDYNTYRIEHPEVNGILYVASLPMSIRRVPAGRLSGIPTHLQDNARYVISYNSLVNFVNLGEASAAKTTKPWKNEYAASEKKTDLFSYVAREQSVEPWNEYVVQEDGSVLVRTRTILANVHAYPGFVNQFGDPVIGAQHNTTLSVSSDVNAEHGMT